MTGRGRFPTNPPEAEWLLSLRHGWRPTPRQPAEMVPWRLTAQSGGIRSLVDPRTVAKDGDNHRGFALLHKLPPQDVRGVQVGSR